MMIRPRFVVSALCLISISEAVEMLKSNSALVAVVAALVKSSSLVMPPTVMRMVPES